MMKMKKLKLSFLLLPLIAAIGLLVAACSSDEEIAEDVAVDFYLSNEHGERANSFKCNENIYFNISLRNYSDKAICISDENEPNMIMTVFGVFASDGNWVGFPYDSFSITDGNWELERNSVVNWHTCWMVHQTKNRDCSPFYMESLKDSLPKGEYYTEFSFLLNNEKKSYKVFFKIEE